VIPSSRWTAWRERLPAPGLNLAAIVALGAVLLLGLGLRVVWWYGLVSVDPFAYADAAASIANGHPVYEPDLLGSLYYTQYLRLSLIVPAAALYRVFGPGEVQSTLFPIICSLGSAVVAYLLVMQIARDRLAAVIAAFVTCIFPLSVINSTQFLPDTVLAFFSGVTILAYWHGLEAKGRSWRYRALVFMVTGVAWALAFYGRQTAIGLVLPLGALTLYQRRFDPAVLWGVAGALIVALAMTAVLVAAGAEPFADVRAVIGEGRGSQPGAIGYTDIDFTYAEAFVSDPMFVPLVLVALLALAVVVATWRKFPEQQRPMVGLLIVIVGLYLYFEFMMRLPSLYSWIKEPRYVLTMVVPVSALCGLGLSRARTLVGPAMRFAPVAGMAGVLALYGWYAVDSVRADHAYWREHRIDQLARELAAVLDEQPEDTVYIWNDDLAQYTAFHVGLGRTSFYERAHGSGYFLNRFDANGHSQVAPGSLVVMTNGQDQWSKPTAHAAHWELVWSEPGGTSLWRVPVAPEAGPVESADAPSGGVVRVSAFGVSEGDVLPQHHVALTVEVANGGAAAVVRVGLDCGAGTIFRREITAAAGTSTLAFDFPVDAPALAIPLSCRLMAATSGGDPFEFGVIVVGAAVSVQAELGLSYDPDFERARGSSWYRADDASFTEGGSAEAIEPFGPLYLPLPELAGGDFWVDLGLYDEGDGGSNTIRLSLNGVSVDVEWGGAGGLEHRVVQMKDVPAGANLTIEVVERGQAVVRIDDVVVSTIPPP